jgi:membrane protein DedA with SNARE-associated domain
MAVTAEIEHLFGNLAPYVHHYGAAAVTVILTLESIGFPLPGESLLIFASRFLRRAAKYPSRF